MDLVTHGLLGGCVGQVVAQKRLGRRAIIGGAIASLLPDADMIVAFFQDPLNVFIHHRGITHSLFFGPIVGPFLAFLTFSYYKGRKPYDSYAAWASVFILGLLIHPLLDWFTTYGTQLLAPFSNHRFSLNAVGIIDPFYSFFLLLPCLIGLFNYQRLASISSTIMLMVTTGYLLWGIQQNDVAIKLAQQQLQEEHVPYQRVNAYPTLLQIFLRRVVVHTPEEFRVGFLSTWAPRPICWHIKKKADSQHQQTYLAHEKAQIFAWFTEQQYAIAEDKINEGNYRLNMYDLRLGYPGKTLWGIWQLNAILEPEKGTLSNVHLETQKREKSGQLLKDSFLAAFGYPSPLFPTSCNETLAKAN